MGWIILLLIVLLFVFLFSRFIRVRVVINDDVCVKLRYLFITYQLIPEKGKKIKKQKKKKVKTKLKSKQSVYKVENITRENPSFMNNTSDNAKTDKTSDDTVSKKKLSFDKKMRNLESKFNKIKNYFDIAKAPLLKFIKKIFIDIRLLNIIIGGSDPATTALTFGAYNMIIGNILGWVSSTMNLSLEAQNIDIRADFKNLNTVYNVDITIRVRVFTAIVLAVSFAVNYIKNTSKKTPIKAGKDVKNG